MFVVRITMTSMPDKQLEVMQTLLSMIEPTGIETGCLSYAGFRDIENMNRFNLLGEWESREDLDRYIRSARFGVLLGTKSLLREPPQIEIHTVSSSEGMESVNAVRSGRSES
jgi:quinol monooxygenase YgiN